MNSPTLFANNANKDGAPELVNGSYIPGAKRYQLPIATIFRNLLHYWST